MKKILCFSGGKDSTALLIYIYMNNLQLDEVIYIDMGSWIWDYAKDHIKQVELKFNLKITVINAQTELETGFKKWGFPHFRNRWCTGIKRELIRKYLQNKYKNEEVIQYIGLCADETKRIKKNKLIEYPLLDAGITTEKAKELCKKYGFNFGNNYQHHSHFNCWLCPLQKVNELKWIYDNKPELWDILINMQKNCIGYYSNKKTIFDYSNNFWNKDHERLKKEMLKARGKTND